MMTEEQVAERLATDAKFCIETFFNILDKDRKQVPFLLNPPQQKYYANRTHQDLILKARKEGFSSLIEAIWLHDCMFQENVRAVTMSHEMESTVRHFERVRYFLDHMGVDDITFDWELDQESQKQIRFKATNSTYWIGTAGAKAFGRGDDITHLHLSEVAWYDNQSVITGVMEACVNNAWKVMETTANGVGELFYRMWQASKNKENSWKGHFFAWFDDPTNTLALPAGVKMRWDGVLEKMKRQYKLPDEKVHWYRQKRKDMPEPEKMPQEYPSSPAEAFLSSGKHVFDLHKLQAMRDKCTEAPWLGQVFDDGQTVEWQDNSEGELKVWKHPRQGRFYLIFGDSAEGLPDGDYQVAQVFDRSSWEQVAIWRGRTDPGSFGKVLCDLGYYFQNAILIPENNNHGWGTIERIKSLQYPHLLNTREIWPDDKSPKPGFPTNEKTKGLMITAARNAVNGDWAWINDVVTVDEMMTYVKRDDGTLGPQDENHGHDDCCTSWAGGVYCLKFLGVDETYAPRARMASQGPMSVSSITGKPKRRAGLR